MGKDSFPQIIPRIELTRSVNITILAIGPQSEREGENSIEVNVNSDINDLNCLIKAIPAWTVASLHQHQQTANAFDFFSVAHFCERTNEWMNECATESNIDKIDNHTKYTPRSIFIDECIEFGFFFEKKNCNIISNRQHSKIVLKRSESADFQEWKAEQE